MFTGMAWWGQGWEGSNVHFLVHFLYLLYLYVEHISLMMTTKTNKNDFILKQTGSYRPSPEPLGPLWQAPQFLRCSRGRNCRPPEVKQLDPGHACVDLGGPDWHPFSSSLSHLYTTEAPPPATMVQILPLGFNKVSFKLAPLLASRSAM